MSSRTPGHVADLRGAVSIGIQECLRNLEESLADLSEAQFAAFPMEGEENIALIALRTLQNLDDLAVAAQGGPPSFPHDEHWEPAGLSQASDFGPEAEFPTRIQVLTWLGCVRHSAEALLDVATNDDMCRQRNPDGPWPGTASSAYLAAIYHSVSQVQRIWLLRGLQRAPGKSRLQAAREASANGTEPPKTVAELHYGALVEGNLFLWRATLIRELRSPRRVAGLAPMSWWEAGRRSIAAGATYRYAGEEDSSATERTLQFARHGGSDASPATVTIQLTLTDEGWRVNAAEY